MLAAADKPSGGSGSGSVSGELKKGFGPCVGGVRDLYFYTDGPTTCPASHKLDVQMAEGLSCGASVRCAPGSFLSANRTVGADHKAKWQSSCEACPKGKFSVGGGKIYSGMSGAWKSFPRTPLEFHTHCVSRRGGRWAVGQNCAPWERTANGTILSSGNNTGRVENEATVSILSLNANFVRDGYVKYSFRVEAEECTSWATDAASKAKYQKSKGKRCGDGLDFVLDVDVVGERYSYEPDWWFVKQKVPKGSHTLKWEYYKDGSGDGGADRAEINLIEVVGTAHADLECAACSYGNGQGGAGGGGSAVGGSSAIDADEDFEWDDLKYTNGGTVSEHCASCEAPDKDGAFWYADDTEYKHPCIRCPAGRYSVPGKNIGWKSCLQRPRCNLDDMVRNHSACDGTGKRRRFYTWAQPHTCIEKWGSGAAESMNLTSPADAGKMLACPPCGVGFFTPPGAKAHSCTACPTGAVRDPAAAASTSTACTPCPAGQVATRHFSVHAGSGQVEWNAWPRGFRADRALVNGWGLTAGGVASAAQHYSFNSDETLLLDANVPDLGTAAAKPSLSFEYEIQYLPDQAYSDAEVELTFSVNGKQHAVPGGRRAIADATSWGTGKGVVGKVAKVTVSDLPLGKLVLQWRWRRTSMPWGSPERVVIRSLMLSGTNLGGGAACVACPAGTQPDAARFGCVPCGLGTFSAAAGAPCTPCGTKLVSGHSAIKCTECGASMVPSADGSECVVGGITMALTDSVRGALADAANSGGDVGGSGSGGGGAGGGAGRRLEDWVSDRILDAFATPSAAQQARSAAPPTNHFDFDLGALARLGSLGSFAHGGGMVQALDKTTTPDDWLPPRLFFVAPLSRSRPVVGGTAVVGGAWVDGVWQPGRGTGSSSSSSTNDTTRISDPPMMVGGAYIVELVDHRGGATVPNASAPLPPPLKKTIPGFGNALCRPKAVYGAVTQLSRMVSVQPLADARSDATKAASALRLAGAANATGTNIAKGDRPAVGIAIKYRPMDMGASGSQQQLGDGVGANSWGETAELRLICDPSAALGSTQPRFHGGWDPMQLEWRTAAACPICRADFFRLERTECIGGERTELWRPFVPCYDDGTFTPGKEKRLTCKEVVVTKRMALWFTLSLGTLGLLALLLLCYLLHVRRKSSAMYSKYLQLQTSMKGNDGGGDGIVIADEGGGQTSFEFNISDGTGIGDDEEGDDEDGDFELPGR